jgi:hypothetical protein
MISDIDESADSSVNEFMVVGLDDELPDGGLVSTSSDDVTIDDDMVIEDTALSVTDEETKEEA